MTFPIGIVTTVILDAAGRVLVVRKRGSHAFLQPGGRREAGEDALRTLARELREELCGIARRRGGCPGHLRGRRDEKTAWSGF